MLRRAALMAADTLASAGVSGGVIQDSWDKIIEIAQAGRASEFYSVGNKKSLSWGWQGTINMILVGINVDTKSDGTGKANMTWMASSPLSKQTWYEYKKKATTSTPHMSELVGNVSYSTSTVAYYTQGLELLLPKNVQQAIVKVKKTFCTDGGTGATSQGDYGVWIPSGKELSCTYQFSETLSESTGVVYGVKPSWFSISSEFWLRGMGLTSRQGSVSETRYGALYCHIVNSNFHARPDGSQSNYAQEARSILPCFCL
ncbi:MAG: hypothetical protein K2H85_11720 [Allobaculum sp.]|nr:hypothetical protein [Allobaculum sp.]